MQTVLELLEGIKTAKNGAARKNLERQLAAKLSGKTSDEIVKLMISETRTPGLGISRLLGPSLEQRAEECGHELHDAGMQLSSIRCKKCAPRLKKIWPVLIAWSFELQRFKKQI